MPKSEKGKDKKAFPSDKEIEENIEQPLKEMKVQINKEREEEKQRQKKGDAPDVEWEEGDEEEALEATETSAEIQDVPEEEPEAGAVEEDEDTLRDQVLRAMAEVENMRKRAEREKEDARKYAIARFAEDLISVLENLRRAEENVPLHGEETNEVYKNIHEGIKLTKNELLKVFEKHGITRINPLGEPFDHNYHQAVAHVENTGEDTGTVVDVLQAGYIIKDRLLRPAMVAVAK